MPSSDDQHRLNARQRREIDQIGQKFHFNLAPPPSSLDEITTGPKFVSLTDFIEQFDWEYSDLDIVDRREIKHLAAENFWRYIGKSEVPLEEPGHLSAVTVAKGIEECVRKSGVTQLEHETADTSGGTPPRVRCSRLWSASVATGAHREGSTASAAFWRTACCPPDLEGV